MIVNHDIRGMQAHAKLTLISSGKNALAKRISNPKPIQEQAKTPFTGLTTDMRGRDGQGYAVCKSFNEKQKKNNICLHAWQIQIQSLNNTRNPRKEYLTVH